jgi:thiol-disulfide isomerase/thioredoxin
VTSETWKDSGKMVAVVLLVIIAFGALYTSAQTSMRAAKIAAANDEGLPTKLLPKDEKNRIVDFTLTDAATGTPVHLSSELKNGPVVFSFWATWCGPCREELPELEKLSKKYAGRIKFLGVNSSDGPKSITEFERANQLSLQMLSDSRGTVSTQYAVNSIPQLYVADRNGYIRLAINGYGPGEADDLTDLLDKLLAEK